MKKIILVIILLGSIFTLVSCKNQQQEEKVIYFSVLKDGKYGAINHLGELVIPFTYDTLSPFTAEGIALAKDSEGSHLINSKNKKIVTHEEIKHIEQRYTIYSRTPQRPSYFEAIVNNEKLIYNSKAGLILTLENVTNQGIVIHDEDLRVFIDDRIYVFDVNQPRFDLMDSYDLITKFYDNDGYLALKGKVYSFLDAEYNVINSVEVLNGSIYQHGDIFIYKEQSLVYVYTKQGNRIGNQAGYTYGTIQEANEEYIFHIDQTQQMQTIVDHHSGLRLSNLTYSFINHSNNSFVGIDQNQVAHFYEGSQKLFSLQGYQRTHSFLKADVNLYVISSCCSDTIFEKGVHYVNQLGVSLSKEYKKASAFNEYGIAYVEEDNNYYLINRQFEVISKAYTYITYLHEMKLIFATDYDDEHSRETNYLLDGQGQVLYTAEDFIPIENRWMGLIDSSVTDSQSFMNMYYITDDHEVVEAKNMTYEMFLSLQSIDFYKGGSINLRERLTNNFFSIIAKDQLFKYEQTLYDGYYVFSQGGKYMIMTYDFVQVGMDMYDGVSQMPTYGKLI